MPKIWNAKTAWQAQLQKQSSGNRVWRLAFTVRRAQGIGSGLRFGRSESIISSTFVGDSHHDAKRQTPNASFPSSSLSYSTSRANVPSRDVFRITQSRLFF